MRVFGISLVLAGFALYLVSTGLTIRYIRRKTPGLLEADLILPKPRGSEKYLWEHTARSGIVPRWVSFLGLLAWPSAILGLVLIATHWLGR